MNLKSFGFSLFLAGAIVFSGCSKTTPSVNSNAPPSGEAGNTPAAPGSNPGGIQSSSAQNSNAQNGSEPSQANLPAPQPVVISAGTAIEVTVDQSVDSKDNNSGDHFDASLAEPVVIGDKVIIPRGTKATGTVTDAKSAGRFKGNAAISVTLSSVTLHGKVYKVRTSVVTEAGKGRGKRTAVGAGGGAVVGALVGALAGGGKGAAIGAGAGAGAGTAGTALTGSRDITIKPETRLRFRLKAPLEVSIE
jgi:outer membrane lipoprotein SlyB